MTHSWFYEGLLLADTLDYYCLNIEGDCAEGMLLSCKRCDSFVDNHNPELPLMVEELHLNGFQELISGSVTLSEAF